MACVAIAVEWRSAQYKKRGTEYWPSFLLGYLVR